MVHRGEKCYWLAAHHIIDEESQKKPAPIFVEDSLRSSTSATQKEERGTARPVDFCLSTVPQNPKAT
jgi:hypothetical protein